MTDSSGAISASVQFDAFGNVLSGSGTWKGQFGYAGKFGYQQDPDTGLKLLGHRYYDSDTGRFLTRDPAKDGRNWYSYCGNSPVSYFDAEGLAKVWIAWRRVGDTGYYHALLIIKDEKTGKIYIAEAGPHYIYIPFIGGQLKLRGGVREITDGEEYNRIMKYDRTLLVDDEESGDHWIARVKRQMPRGEPDYYPLWGPTSSGNSNSWVRELLENLDLPTDKPKGINLPRWEADPWTRVSGNG